MKRIVNWFRAMLLESVNDVEFKMQHTEEYKEILRQLELKEKQLVDEADKDKIRELLRDIDDINIERYNLLILAFVETIITYLFGCNEL